MTTIRPLDPLEGVQQAASDPERQVWLSASAGTGKTHVLTARVLRLLLDGALPDTILCLTFTKAGAAEMAERIQARLAAWVRMPDAALERELFALDAAGGADAIGAARRLFAYVLDAPGGGLRIQTIHSFCQTLLAAFPTEAGLTPGFEPLEGRAEAALARSTLADLLVAAGREGDLGLIDDVQRLSRRLGEQKAEAHLRRCGRSAAELAALGPRGAIEPRVRAALDVPLGDVEAAIEQAVADERFDTSCLRRIAAANRAWGGTRGQERAATVEDWLASDPAGRAAKLDALHRVWAKKDGEPMSFAKGHAPQVDDYQPACGTAHRQCEALLGLRARAALAVLLAAGLRAGQAYALAYADAKRTQGVVDFDDLIRRATDLLGQPGIGPWIRYKLDRRTDHVLIDEGQDTNAHQWAIVRALADEFFAEERVRERRERTIFAVGDFKQAIFGFQGTDPRFFAAAQTRFAELAEEGGRILHTLSLDRSFRTTAPVLALIDRLLVQLGPERMGLAEPSRPHQTARGTLPGAVVLWQPVTVAVDDAADEGEEGWIDDAQRSFARKLAEQVREWIRRPLWLEGRGRPLRPEDVLILVRKRGDLASLIVARLHAVGVPVAGVDRLRLDAPLAVRDLMAAIRFVLQPDDDLNLAALLVSPLFGASQDDLYRLAFRRSGSLWSAVGDHPAAAGLRRLLARADLASPYQFLEEILSGPLDGRRRLVGRLGQEARDPVEELLNAALAFEGEATLTLQLFLDWFDRDEVEVRRDPSAPLDAVRVMTVHGAKGLQAPLVILADATGDPALSPPQEIGWALAPGEDAVPVLRPRKAERAGALGDAVAAAERAEREEHWRLLYVAATRAEELLFVGGALGPRAGGRPSAESWYAEMDAAMAALGAQEAVDDRWGGLRRYGGGVPLPAAAEQPRPDPQESLPIPEWLRRPAPQESRPSRPLAPSSLGEDGVSDPPPTPALQAAARRGRLIHALFERLPAVIPAERGAAGERWLATSAGVTDPAERAALVAAVCGIIADPAHAALFAPDALAEAPVAAVLPDGLVVSGTVDRVRVDAERVLLVDFKTGRRVPAGLDDIPAHHLRQMAAYAAALAVIFPDRRIEAALLYTSGPAWFALPQPLLLHHKPSLADAEQMLDLHG